MLKKSITYTDFNDQQRTEDFYFNLSKAEVMEYEIRNAGSGGLESLLKEVAAAQDGNRIMDIFRDIIGRSYGVKGPDGRSFIKNKELTDGFMGSEAYSELFMEFMYNPDKAAEFINGIIPKGVVSPEGNTSNPTQPAQQFRPPTQDHQQKQPVTRNVPEFPSIQQAPQYPGPERPIQDVQLPQAPPAPPVYQDRPYLAEPERQAYQETRPPHEATQPFREPIDPNQV